MLIYHFQPQFHWHAVLPAPFTHHLQVWTEKKKKVTRECIIMARKLERNSVKQNAVSRKENRMLTMSK